MQVGSKEFYDIMDVFEREYRYMRMDKEPKEGWKRGVVYEDPVANREFAAFLKGYSLGRVSYLNGRNGE